MDTSVFIANERAELRQILSKLPPGADRDKLLPKVRHIEFLLQALEQSRGTPQQKQKKKKKITKETDKLENRFQAISLRGEKITKETVPDSVREDALMTKASGLHHDNGQNTDSTQDYLNDNNINYTVDGELSNQDSLVLQNKETGDTRIAYRGTKWTNTEDWVTDARIAFGVHQGEDPQFVRADDQLQSVTRKYGVKPEKLVSYSKGSGIAIKMGDKYNIDTSNLNPLIGRNEMMYSSNSNAKHALHRISLDIPSMGAGARVGDKNWSVDIYPPLTDSLDPRVNHDNMQFIDRGKRAPPGKATLEALENKYKALNYRALEAQNVGHMAAYHKGESLAPYQKEKPSEPVSEPESEWNMDHDFMEHQLQNNYPDAEELWSEATDFDPDPFPAKNKTLSNLSNLQQEIQGNALRDSLEQRMAALGGHKLPKFPDDLIIPEPPKKKTFTDFVHHEFNKSGGTDTVVKPNSNMIKLAGNRLGRHMHVWDTMTDGAFTPEEKEYRDNTEFEEPPPKEKLLTDSEIKDIYNASPEERENILQGHRDAMDDAYTDMEEATDFSPKQASQPAKTSQTKFKSGFKEAIHPYSQIKSFGVGSLAAVGVNSLMNNLIDPPDPKTGRTKMDPNKRSAISGGLTGGLAEQVGVRLAGGRLLSTSELAPVVAGAAVGQVAGDRSYEYLRGQGVGKRLAATDSGGIGGIAGGATTAVVGAGAATLLGAEEGTYLGAFLAPETAGLSVAAGAAIGAGLGFASAEYEEDLKKPLHEAWTEIKSIF